MTTKTYASRDSATSALRKLGIQACDYDLFITKIDGKFECNLGAAAEHLESLKNPKPETITEAAVKAAKIEKPRRAGISATARALILAGKTNQEVWAVLKDSFNLDESKKHYPTWYRCEMKRKGLLPKEA
jgi:hypothetical protein